MRTKRLTARQREKFKAAVLTELRESLTPGGGVSEERLACEVLKDVPGDALAFLRDLCMNGYVERCKVGFAGHTIGYKLVKR